MKIPSLSKELAIDGENFCEHCQRKLNPEQVEWLEYSILGKWAEPETTDWEKQGISQGLFPVGKTCAKKLLKNAD